MNTNSYLNLGGTIRARDPNATLYQIAPLFDKLGITRVANVTGLDRIGIPVALCIRPNSKYLSVSQGKGMNWELAKISSIMESIEGFHVENPPPIDLVGKYKELQNQYPLINPNLFAKGFCQNDRQQLSLEWIRATNWLTKKIVYIPRIVVCLDSTLRRPEYAFFNVNSNGLAAGNTFEEAMCHGLYEIIERDSLSRFNKLPSVIQNEVEVNLNSIDSSVVQSLIKDIKNANLVIRIWDVTSFLGIPTYRCMIAESNPIFNIGMFYGSGTHLEKEIAIIRAITEAAQARLTIISGSRDDVFPNYYFQKHSFKINNNEDGILNYASRATELVSTSFFQVIDFLIERLCDFGFSQLIVVNHTKSELNIPVVQLFVLGSEFEGL